jgi:uncharacterized membrane protein
MSEQSGGPPPSGQQPSAPPPGNNKTSTGIQPNLAGLLCYVLGWITGIVFLILEKENRFVRFHAVQSIFVFGAITIIEMIFGWIPILGWIINTIFGVVAFILWILLMYKAYQGKMYKLPWVGNIAEKQSKPTV